MVIKIHYFKDTLLEKPREKASRLGMSSLSDVELLALLLETGDKHENVLELSNRYLKEKGGLSGVFSKEEKELLAFGVKKAKVFRLLAVKEVLVRLPLSKGNKIPDSDTAFEKSKYFFLGRKTESLLVFYLSANKNLIKQESFDFCEISQVYIPIKAIIKEAMKEEANSVILLHNHTSGSLVPSRDDEKNTKEISFKLKGLGILLLDSLIVFENEYASLRKLQPSLFDQ